jgi:outer membrane receptor for monomeric catechols
VFGRYNFTSGFLKGFAFGGGYSYRSDNVLARLRKSDGGTPAKPINQLIKGDSLWNATAFMSYKFAAKMLGEKRNITINLNVANLFQNDIERTVLRVRTVGTGTVAGVGTTSQLLLDQNGNTVPFVWGYKEPREYHCSITMEF